MLWTVTPSRNENIKLCGSGTCNAHLHLEVSLWCERNPTNCSGVFEPLSPHGLSAAVVRTRVHTGPNTAGVKTLFVQPVSLTMVGRLAHPFGLHRFL